MTLTTPQGSPGSAPARRPRGIPTTYRGTRFRSRLEARWAAFFDEIRWSWVYEPFDLDGWIPDFVIEGAFPFLVEVGPCLTEPDFIIKGEKARAALPPKQILRGTLEDGVWIDTPEHWTLVTGVNARVYEPQWLAEAAGYWAVDGWGLHDTPAWWQRCSDCGVVSIESGDHGGYARPCGHATEVMPRWTNVGRFILDAWTNAGNATQWRGRR